MSELRRAEAQLYDEADYVRIFDDTEETSLMDITLRGEGDNKERADNALANTIFRRSGRWVRREWGWTCKLKLL